MTPEEQARITAIIRSVKNARRHTGPVQLSRNDFLGICDRIQSLEAEVARLREALAFAESCIKSGEPWTQTCEEMFGKAREALGGGE